MSTAGRLVVIGLVAVLGAAASLVAVTSLRDEGPVANASAGPSEAGSAGQSAAPSASTSEDVEAAFAEIEAQVRELRGLPAPDIGPAEIIDRAQLAVELDEMLAEEWTDEELARSNLTLQAMGLLTPEQDLRELSQALLADQVIGFYDPLEKRMVVVSDEGLSALARITYAHEYTHALQDEAFGSFAARDELTDDDAILARQALEEGDATLVMFGWALQGGNLTPQELQEVGTTPQPDTSEVPGWMLRQLEFPYSAGLTFAMQLRGSGDWAAVNDAYTRAPTSTEQVLHPEKYLAGEEPDEVQAAALADTLGGGWEDLDPTTMGEVMIDIWLVELGADQIAATGAAAGWGGDRLAVARGPDGDWAMAWRVTWDSAADADEFQAAHEGLQAGGDIRSTLVRASPIETVILHAPSDDLLAGLVSAFGG
jgi:hypothetical protein